MKRADFRVIIVGAGPVGLFMAHALQRAGIDFVVLERQKTVPSSSGQLLFIWPQTVRLFDQLGLWGQIQKVSLELHWKKRTSGTDGQVLTTSNFWDSMRTNHGYPFLPVQRGDLVLILWRNLRDDACIKTSAEVVEIVTTADGVDVQLKDGSTIEGSIVIGADGVHSETRRIMQKLVAERFPSLHEENPMSSRFYGIFGRAYSGTPQVEAEVLFESRGSGTAIQCIRNGDCVHFVTLTPLPQETASRTVYTPEDRDMYAEAISDVAICPGVRFGDVWQHADKKTSVLVNQEEGFLQRWSNDRIVLVGDAVHKGTSVNGLGLTCGLHSATVLVNELHSLLEKAHMDSLSTTALRQTFERYQQLRENECRTVWEGGRAMVRDLTRTFSWTMWTWHAYVLPWVDIEWVARGVLVSLLLVRHGQLLSYIPFDGEHGTIPWLQTVLPESNAS